MPNKKDNKNHGKYKIDPHDLDLVAVESDPVKRARERLFDVDAAMRRNYDALKAKVSANLNPVIIVQPDLRGGNYTLILDGKRTTVYPVSPLFQMVKSIAHFPLGIYTILAPYLKDTTAKDWQADLANFKKTAKTALENLHEAGLPAEAEKASRKILSKGIRFIDESIRRSDFTIEDFKKFSASLHKSILVNMSFAAAALVSGIKALLDHWCEEMGEENWKNLYTVILAIWTTETQNQHYEILRRLMYRKKVEKHLIVISVGEQEQDMVAVALDNLGRIVQDNVAAGLILPTDDELAETLAGEKDLLADAVDAIFDGEKDLLADAVNAIFDGKKDLLTLADKVINSCPHSAPHRRR